jgi:hypothetical protein
MENKIQALFGKSKILKVRFEGFKNKVSEFISFINGFWKP